MLCDWARARTDTCLLSSDSERVFSHRALLSLHSRLLRSQVPAGDLEEVTSASEVSCHQTENYETVCNVSSSVEAECQHLVQLTCSSCHFHASLPPVNTSLAVLSPLYPVLQPDYICEYDFFSDSPQDVSLHIEDINLPGHQYSQGHDSEYLWQRCCKV